MRGADKLGYRHRPLARNAPDCDGQGVCCFGCPTDAKRSTNVSYVPLALRAGAELYTGARVERLLFEGGRAVGVRARVGEDGAGGRGAPLTVRARAVVVACGALVTPVFLMRNGVAKGSRHLGGNLSIHPAVACLAEMNERVESWKGVPQGYLIDEFADDGIMMEGVATPLEYTIAATSHVGPRLVELAEGFDRVASFGMMVSDTSRGRVRLIGDRAVVTYNLNDEDVGRLQRGVDQLSRIFFAAGARTVLTPFHGHDELRSPDDLRKLQRAKLRASEIMLAAHHPLGTARMGRTAQSSVVDQDHQVHGVPGLHVIDGSTVPTALGVNPQVTIMAMATRAAGRLAARLG
jgi:choline dehydrogenase-like flavoprotein